MKIENKQLENPSEKYISIGGGAVEESPEEGGEDRDLYQELETYSYFDGAAILKSVEMKEILVKRGRKYLQQGKIILESISSGFTRGTGSPCGQAEGIGIEGSTRFHVSAVFNRNSVLELNCGCSVCRWAYDWYSAKIRCPYTAGLLQAAEKELGRKNMGDATDINTQYFLDSYLKHTSGAGEKAEANKGQMLHVIPRLVKKDGKLKVSFRVGAQKLFVIKNLEAFTEQVRNGETVQYGSSTMMKHSRDSFDDRGCQWIDYISRIVQDESSFMDKIRESWDYYYERKKLSSGNALDLFGWRLDSFYEQMAEEGVEYEDRDQEKKAKCILHRGEGTPRIYVTVSENKITNDGNFHGVSVLFLTPEIYRGNSSGYYIEEDRLCRIGQEQMEKIWPVADRAENGVLELQVGRNHLGDFYHDVLPQLQDIAVITETDPERFHSFLPSDVRFLFCLDSSDREVSCRPYALYGKQQFSLMDMHKDRENTILEAFRNMRKEERTLQKLMKWFPAEDLQREELYLDDENAMYDFLRDGVEELLELGEVRGTQRFLNTPVISRVPVSVGVSVSEAGMLDLKITTDTFSEKELLELLKSYRAKKKYYRMKNGAFVNLQDPAIDALNELTGTLHLKEGDLAKGNTQLPAYRSLYLDKLLEENESIYSNRDAHFRKMIKDFKTVKDSDFEEPESLRERMRGYQREGYKWMRTLQRWGFGGILADDMGLGKTLQMISVLLAEKQEGNRGTSLVICPASLIYNWEEEIQRFAPELKAQVVAGTQGERIQILEKWENADVLITSYDLLKRDIKLYEGKNFLYEIIDEAQYIKNHTTAAAKAVKVIRSRSRFALTGTPIENRLSELWSIFDYLMPGFLYGYESFRRELELPIVKEKDEKALERLQKMVRPFILRRLKEDVLKDLPEKLEESRYVKLEKEQRYLYDAQVLQLRRMLESKDEESFGRSKLQILAQMTKLRQLCCDPSLCLENYHGEKTKLEACLQLIHSAIEGGHRILVFSQFTSMLKIIEERLEEEKISCFVITGETSKEKRLQLVKEFNEGCVPVFLISLKAGGVGLNLTGADVVVHYDPWWNLAAQNQATDRAHRIGQTRKVSVYKLIARDTIEEKIEKLQMTKKDLADQVVGGELGQLGTLSREEMLELLM